MYVANGKHEPLVTKELYKTVQDILDKRNKHSCRRRKYFWPLGGFLFCARHGCRFTSEWHLGKSLAYYHCTNRSGCSKYVEMNKMEEMVAEKFRALEFTSEFITAVTTEVKKILYERRSTHNTKRQGFVNERSAWESKKKVAEDKLLEGLLSDDDFEQKKKEIQQEIDIIDEKLIGLEKQQDLNIDVIQEILSFTRNVYDAYQKASPQLRRKFLSLFWERFEIEDGVIIKSVSSPLFEHLLKLEYVFLKSENALNNGISGVIKSELVSPESVSEFVM